MTDRPVYRWEQRRAGKDRRDKFSGAISTQDLVMLAVVMAMLVIVLRIIMIFGSTIGMEIGPFTPATALRDLKPMPYADGKAVTESFRELKFISAALFIYWGLASWQSLSSQSIGLSTKLFKATIGTTILILLIASFLPDHALYIADIWFERSFHPQDKS